MRALLVDDERLARARLRKLLEEAHAGLIEVVAEADSVDAAEAALAAHAPDLVFLDVAMPGGSGFELLARRRLDARVVFVTAHDEHALRAFEVGAADYLLKPVEPERLRACIARLSRAGTVPPDRIALTDGAALRLIAVDEILLVRADGDYSELLLRDGSTHQQKLPLARWEARLGPAFLRVHRGTLVALSAALRLERGDGSTYRLYLRDLGAPVTVSRAHAAALRAALKC